MTTLLTGDRLRRRIIERLQGTAPSADVSDWRLAGMTREHSAQYRAFFPDHPAPAAVLVPLVDHGDGLTVLLTQRASHLKNHAGQISFPGGRIEPEDGSALNAALRETREEIGLTADYISVVGYLPDHLIISGYRVTPVVAIVRPGFELRLDPTEVDDTFEVPLGFVFDPVNHQSRLRRLGEEDIEVFDIPFGERHIWGATAGMLMSFYRTVVQDIDP